jgi:hypothetical protein
MPGVFVSNLATRVELVVAEAPLHLVPNEIQWRLRNSDTKTRSNVKNTVMAQMRIS